VTNELVQDNFDCFKLISKAIELTRFSSEENLLQKPRKGLETHAIVACGGKYTLCYLPGKDEWKRLADGLSETDHHTKMISFCDQLYVFPPAGKAGRYDPVFNGWSTLDMITTRSAKVAVVRGEIYAIEIDTSTKKSTIKRYDVERCSWQIVLSSHEGCRENSCVVVAGNHLYVCGGKLEMECCSEAERFDTVENKWEEIANMQEKRESAFGAATDGKIFVAGGKQGTWWLKTCEIYDIFMNEWQSTGSLNVLRACGSIVCLKGTFYVLGGIAKSYRGELSVECYDPIEEEWFKKTTIPVKTISNDSKDFFTGSVLKLSKGVLDKLDIV